MVARDRPEDVGGEGRGSEGPNVGTPGIDEAAMRCPYCKANNDKVIDSRTSGTRR